MAPAWKIEVSPDVDGIVRVTTTTAVGFPASAVEELTGVIYSALGSFVPRSEQKRK
jgi:hypothetical protein